MHIIPPGLYRVDVLILISYQMCHFFSIQQIFPVFLNYTPKTACVETAKGKVCYDVPKSKCMQFNNEFPNVCANLTGTALSDCHTVKSHSYYTSAAMEFEIFCRPGWKDFRPAFVQYVGVLIGNIILGYVADQMGRKKTFILSMLIGIPSLSLSATFNSIAAFYFFRAMTGIGIAGTMIVGWAYFSELVSPHQRFKLRTFSNWANARIMLTLVALLTGDWRLSSHVSAVISLITLAIVYFILPESHIWLRKKGRYVEAEESRKRIAALAGIEFVPMPPPEKVENAEPEKAVNILTVFADPQLRKNILILWLMWFVTGITAYLTDLCGGDMTANFWVGQFLSGILLSAVRIIMGFADGYLPWMGRRFVLLSCQSLAIFFFGCVIAFLYAGEKGQWYYTAVYLASFVFTSICWEPCYLCASELMPTDVRATSTASCSIVGRFANIGASMLSGLKTVYEPGVHMISISLGITNVIAAYFFLQETKNCSLDKAGTAASKPAEKANEQEMTDLIDRTVAQDIEKK